MEKIIEELILKSRKINKICVEINKENFSEKEYSEIVSIIDSFHEKRYAGILKNMVENGKKEFYGKKIEDIAIEGLKRYSDILNFLEEKGL